MLCELGQLEISTYLIDYGADDLVRSAPFRIIRRSYEVNTLLTKKFLRHIDLLLVLWIIDGYRMSSEHLDDLHAWDICLSVSEVDHMRERDSLLSFLLAGVDLLVVTDAEDTLVDLEKELSLRGIVYCYSWPFCLSFFII